MAFDFARTLRCDSNNGRFVSRCQTGTYEIVRRHPYRQLENFQSLADSCASLCTKAHLVLFLFNSLRTLFWQTPGVGAPRPFCSRTGAGWAATHLGTSASYFCGAAPSNEYPCRGPNSSSSFSPTPLSPLGNGSTRTTSARYSRFDGELWKYGKVTNTRLPTS